jgi:hypothetical protein
MDLSTLTRVRENGEVKGLFTCSVRSPEFCQRAKTLLTDSLRLTPLSEMCPVFCRAAIQRRL